MDDKIAILEKYNFWTREIPDTGLLRDDYLNRITGFISNKLIKVLVGQRRVGKSYIMRQLIGYLIKSGVNPYNIVYINMEFTDFGFIENYLALDQLIAQYATRIKPKGRIYFFIDEIQQIAGWEKLINSYSQDYTKNVELFISGSNSDLLSGELAGYLSGRYVQFQVFPFSYTEYLSRLNVRNNKENFLSYLHSGGLPELYNLQGTETQRHYVAALKDTILLRDIIQRYKINDAKLLEDVFVFLINNASNLVSINNIVNYFKSKNRKTSYDTIAGYIQYLKNSYLVHQVERYQISGKETMSGIYKYYINDLAFNNFLYPGYSYGIGYKLENLVYLQLLSFGFEIYVGYMRNKEVDFVALKNTKPLYIQVAYILNDAETMKREYAPLEAINDSYPKIVVTMDDVVFEEKLGINHVQVWKLNEFLMAVT